MSMREAFIIGTYCTEFRKWPDRTVKDLTREAYINVLADAGMEDGGAIEGAWFGNCGMWVERQGSIRGQVCFAPLEQEGRFPERVPIINVEAGCATASLALSGAWKEISGGHAELCLAIGVEKTFYPGAPEQSFALYNGGIDQYDTERRDAFYREAARSVGREFTPSNERTIFMDTYALQANWHMQHFGTSQRQIAAAAAKNHCHGALNPKAQYRFPMTIEQVLADRPVTYPLTRAMCSPLSDGAAAAIVASAQSLAKMPPRIRERAVRIAAMGLSGGKYRRLDEPGLSRNAAHKAYRQSGLGPGDIDVAEVHDATSYCEIYQAEMLDFCPDGAGGAFVESGATTLGGKLPINTSGGLVSKGHPVGATGLSMIYELTQQLRGEAGERQVLGARTALAENGGGVIGFDEAACVVTILTKD
jgi:acetyl-CoA acetyltransferase